MTARKARRRKGRGRSGQLTYYAAAAQEEPEPAPAPPRDDPLHGYAVADLDRIARSAAMASSWAASDFTDRMETAWDAAAVFILTCAGRPERRDVAIAARRAVLDMVTDAVHHWGYASSDPAAGIASAPRFWAYWFREPGGALDEAVTDRVGAAQVWAALSGRDRAVISARAAAASRGEAFDLAAEALGVSPLTCKAYLAAARRSFAELWHAPDAPPSGPKHPDRQPAKPHHQPTPDAPCGTLTAYNRHRRRGEPVDPACEAGAREERRRNRLTRGVTVHLLVGERGATACGRSSAGGALPAGRDLATVTCRVCAVRHAAAVRRQQRAAARKEAAPCS